MDNMISISFLTRSSNASSNPYESVKAASNSVVSIEREPRSRGRRGVEKQASSSREETRKSYSRSRSLGAVEAAERDLFRGGPGSNNRRSQNR
jgi:hypothetical protein